MAASEAADGTEKPLAAWVEIAEARLSKLNGVRKGWESNPPERKAFAESEQEALDIRNRADACVSEYSARLGGIQERLTALGEPDIDAVADIRKAKDEFEAEQQRIVRQLAVCRLLAIGARDLRDAISEQRRKTLSRQLLDRGNPIWDTLSGVIVNGLPDEPSKRLIFEPWPALGAGGLLLAVLVPIMLMLRRALVERFPIPDAEETGAPLRRTILVGMYHRRAPWLVGLLTATATLELGGATPLAAITAAVMITLAVAPMVQLLICHGKLRCSEGLPARVMVAHLLLGGALLFIKPALYMSDHALYLLRGALLLSMVGSALWLLHRLIQRDGMATLRNLRLPIAIALLAGPTAEWLGYHNLGPFLTLGVYGTAVGGLFIWLTLSMMSRVFDVLNDSENETQPSLRKWLGYTQGERIPGTGPMQLLIVIGALVGLVYWALFAWQVSESGTAAIRDFVHNGFSIGAVKIVPAKLVIAVLAFLVLLALARWLQRQLGERWLTKTKLDSGARQSIVSLTSYTIIGIAIMLALSMAGLDFQNLAIVAGALSVGIGFGMQAIVNNFVCGLILLFERPVRPGDWVVVGGTEGYVRKISIRYTLIQTFDRAEVLVPNSELISNQVTNLMLSDAYGRVIVPVGVAYGTNTRKVREILHKVAREHPMTVLHDPRVSSPLVFFIRFGDSSLDFELRFFIRNIDYKMSVRSDILFAIDDAFREAGIEIPFPQRVVHRPPDTPTAKDAEGQGDEEP